MIFSCASTKCRCNTSQRGDTSCWCYLDEAVLECVRCKAPMTKASPGVAVKSGLREGQRTEKE